MVKKRKINPPKSSLKKTTPHSKAIPPPALVTIPPPVPVTIPPHTLPTISPTPAALEFKLLKNKVDESEEEMELAEEESKYYLNQCAII